MLATTSVMAAWLGTRIGLESALANGVIDWITHRPELATPVTGWKQLKEGIYLIQEGLDPYDSGVFHQSPLLLHLFSFIQSPVIVASLYALVDCSSAWILLHLFRLKWPRTTGPISSIKLKDDRWMLSPTYQLHDWHLVLFYLFSPLNVLTSLSKSTVVFNNLAVLLALHGAIHNRIALSMFSLSIGTHLSVYPALLIPSCIAIILDQNHSQSTASTTAKSLALYIVHFLSLGLFTPLSVLFSQLDVNKYLRPNVGLHWYFSIEMFDHFRLFFNVVFQIHLLIYILPLMIKFKNEKLFGFVVMSGIISTFKSYPSIGDTSFSNTLLLLLYPELIACQ